MSEPVLPRQGRIPVYAIGDDSCGDESAFAVSVFFWRQLSRLRLMLVRFLRLG